jgi:predicted transcriptional regulator
MLTRNRFSAAVHDGLGGAAEACFSFHSAGSRGLSARAARVAWTLRPGAGIGVAVARPRSSQPTEAELEILRVLWRKGADGQGCTVREVHESLKSTRGSGYTSVLKIVQIMTEKGLLRRDDSARSHVYYSAVSESSTKQNFVQDLVRRVFDGSASQLLMHALSLKKAKPEELAEIRRMIDEANRGNRGT